MSNIGLYQSHLRNACTPALSTSVGSDMADIPITGMHYMSRLHSTREGIDLNASKHKHIHIHTHTNTEIE